jgi:hypothetical protein
MRQRRFTGSLRLRADISFGERKEEPEPFLTFDEIPR